MADAHDRSAIDQPRFRPRYMKNSITLALTCLLISLCVAKATADSPRAQVRVFDSTIAPSSPGAVSTAIPALSPRESSTFRGMPRRCAAANTGRRLSRVSQMRVWFGSGSSRTRCPPRNRCRRRRSQCCGIGSPLGRLGDRSDRSVSGDNQPPGRPGLVVIAADPSANFAHGPELRVGRGAIDAFVLQKLETAGLTPSTDAGSDSFSGGSALIFRLAAHPQRSTHS